MACEFPDCLAGKQNFDAVIFRKLDVLHGFPVLKLADWLWRCLPDLFMAPAPGCLLMADCTCEHGIAKA